MPTVAHEAFGKLSNGDKVELYTLSNDHGMTVKIMTYGAVITELDVPDRDGKAADIVLGFKDLKGYLQKGVPYFGAIVGRYGNRIGKGQFTLDGKEYQLTVNDGVNHLHGGKVGFDKVIWKAVSLQATDRVGLELTYVSADGEEGYPGELTAKVTYWLTNENELKLDYLATTTKPTTVNLTHHSYFNLKGEGTDSILDHKLTINAPFFTPIDSGLIPTGEIRPVAGTPFDFTKATEIGARIDKEDEQLKFGKGYDHNWVLAKGQKGVMTLAAKVEEAKSGRVMEVWTEEPGIQFYAGNFLDATLTGTSGKAYKHRSGLCLETQCFPDSPNKAQFPTTILRPGEQYKTSTIYKFSTK